MDHDGPESRRRRECRHDRSNIPPGAATRRLSIIGVVGLVGLSAQLMLAVPAGAAAFTGRFSPTASR